MQAVIGLVGLPRSGTTMLSSILAVHPRIEAVYEPWNRDETDERALPDLRLDEFLWQFAGAVSAPDVLLVKETATHLAYLDNVAQLLRSAEPPIGSDLIVLWRNPFHVFLSEIEARQRWWGDPDVVVSPQEFDRWAEPRLGALGRMIELGREFNAVLVSYEALTGDKSRVVPALMEELGIAFDRRQLVYEKHLDRTRVRGDITIATDPLPISDRSVRRREEQLAEAFEAVMDAAWYERVAEAALVMSTIETCGIARFAQPDIEAAAAELMSLVWTGE